MAPRFWGPQIEALDGILGDTDRAGVVVVGGPGAGKSSLVRALLQDSGHLASLSLQCSAALADVAYGALSPFLAELDEVRGPVDVLRAMQRKLDALADPEASGGTAAPTDVRRPPVIVVEDCQFLDAASAFVLAQLGQNREAVLLATSVGLRGESGLNTLVDTGLLATVTMPPLGTDQVRVMCASLSGGHPTDGAVRTILGMTGGSPRLVAAFMASAMDQGLLLPARGRSPSQGRPVGWTLLRPAPAVDEQLIDAVEGMHAELTDEQQAAVTMLALAGRTPRSVLRAVAGDHAQDLADIHLTRGADDGTVELSSVLYAEVLREATPPGRSSVLLEQWQSTGGTALRPTPARSVLWALDNGVQVSDQDRLVSGYECLAAGDQATAWSLAARSDPAESPALALLRAEVMLASARTWSGRSDLVDLADSLGDEHLVGEVLCVLAMDLVRRGEQASSWKALRQVWSEYQERAGQRGRTPLLATGPVGELLAVPDGTGDASEATRLLEVSADLLAAPDVPAPIRCITHWLRMEMLSRDGRLGEAVREAALAYAEVSATPRMTALMGGRAMVQLVLTQVFFGDLDLAEQVLRDQWDGPVHRWHAWSGTVQALQGMLELLRGRIDPAAHALRDARLDLAHADPTRLRSLVEAVYALTTVPAVDEPGPPGESVVDRLLADGRRGPMGQWLLTSALAGLVDELSHAAPSQEVPLWRRVLDEPAMDRYPVLRREILFAAVFSRGLAGDVEELMTRLYDVCASLDGPRSSVIRKVCDPALVSDTVGLARAADEARAAGDLALAAAAWARVVMLHHQANDLRRRGEALRHLQEVVRALGGVPGRYVGEALRLGALTEREHEIVQLALEGLSNADIARVLVVSPRTVEGHLYRVFSKLGISDRAELRGLQL